MKKILIIIKREYLVRVRTRAFLIGTIVTPLLMLALITLPIFFATRGGGDRRVTVLDQSGDPDLYNSINAAVQGRAGSDEELNRRDPGVGTTHYILSRRVVTANENLSAIEEQYQQEADKNPDSTFLVLHAGGLDTLDPMYYAKNTADFSIGTLERSINDAVSGLRLRRAGLDQLTISKYTKRVELSRRKVTAGGGVEEGGRADFVVAFVMLFFIYISVLMYGLFVMRGVIEEKQSRIVEVLVSSVRPGQMMLGKVIGIGLVGLTQIGTWALSAFVLSTVAASIFVSQTSVMMPSIPISLLIYFVLFFLLGYFLYATLYALVGSTVSSEEDAQQAQMPVTMLLVVPMVIFNMILANPTSTSSVVLSMVPFFAPTLMMIRIAVVNPPLWQVVLSMVIMLVTILGCVWVAARIYRVGILMYGKRPSIAELGRWLRYS